MGMIMVDCPICKGKGVVTPLPVVHDKKEVKKEIEKGKNDAK